MSKKAIWNLLASNYHNLWLQKYSLRPTREYCIRELQNIITNKESVSICDAGCGIGQLLSDIKSNFSGMNLKLTGIDSSSAMVNVAGAKHSAIADFYNCPVENITALNQKFDIILCTHSFPYYADQSYVLKEFFSVLKPDGYLILAQACQNTFIDKILLSTLKFVIRSSKYPSASEIKSLTENLFYSEKIVTIPKSWFIPSLNLFVLKKLYTLH